jgi:kinesin family protein C1
MQGGTQGDSRGIIPRAIEQILNTSQTMSSDGWEFAIKASFLEIYNEEINDLLSNSGPAAAKKKKMKQGFMSQGSSSSSGNDATKYTIRQVGAGMVVDNMTEINLTNFGQLQGIVDLAAKNRSVAATDMNAQSSRSHCCFVLHITGVNGSRNTRVQGCLNLVDLAGSERLARSGATGARAKETAAINKSLSALVDVFDALAKKRAHVPFRNSKLTYLMQGCLSGNGKTMMIVNVSPTTASGGETLCSLRFAKQVNQTELGKAKARKTSAAPSSSRIPAAPSTSSSKRSRLPSVPKQGAANRMAKRQRYRQ